MQRQYNLRNPAVKRLMKEAQELREPTEQYHAQPLEDNLFEWHFTIRGPGDSEFEGGLYHGRIVLPPDYPMKPPSIILLTPNGRFEVNKKICLSISGYHPESWQPSWSIRTALLAIIGFMPTHGAGAIGSLDYTAQERKSLAKKSQSWQCPSCGDISNVLPQVTEASKETSKEAKHLASQISFQAEKEKKSSECSSGGVESSAQPVDAPPPPAVSSEQAEASSLSPTHTQSLATSPLTHSFLFPPPPNLADHWHNSSHPTATTTTGPNFPLPFVAPPFRPLFPPLHLLPRHPAVFPPAWHPPGLSPHYPTRSSAFSPTAQPASTRQGGHVTFNCLPILQNGLRVLFNVTFNANRSAKLRF
ncbi:ubiquitin-conjugating enzyme E2 J1-like [Liolophura sinensis]|uniref:ubiquitin-conjugating enzyme E2 J1-like n=1 Tax=Liolophura sinensis TaxID=3198878 RepID=UPI00315818A6